MEGARVIFILMSFLVVVMAVDNEIEERNLQARKSYLESYHPNPHHVVNHLNQHVHMAVKKINDGSLSAARRELSGNAGACVATNPIDQCWRCMPDWDTDRKKLATCALGFGSNTTGGAAGEIYTVEDPSDDTSAEPKPGTLRFGVTQKEPLWIIFASDMTIKLTQALEISSDKTIDGRGARVTICDGPGLAMNRAQNVIVHNIEITNIVPCVAGGSDGDGVRVSRCTNIWLDHLTLSKGTDGLTDITNESTAVTVSNCHFSNHDKVMLLGHCDTSTGDDKMQVTVAFNHFAEGCIQRMPRCRFGFTHVVNNDYTKWGAYAIGGSSGPTILSQGNRFTAGSSKNVCKRVDTPEDVWKAWSWTSQEDLLLDGAVFEQSGSPPDVAAFGEDMIPPKEGSLVSELAKFAGILQCTPGQGC